MVELPLERSAPKRKRKKGNQLPAVAEAALPSFIPKGPVNIVERVHPDLGRLGVFWHTQGSGKSYSMAFFAEKVRRKVPGNFTFLLMTDRNDLDNQIYKTFVGCKIANNETPHAASGDDAVGSLGPQPLLLSLDQRAVGLGLRYRRQLAAVGGCGALANAQAPESRAVSTVGALSVRLLSAAAR